MYKKLLKAVTNLGSPRVLLVGDFLLDSYVYGDALRISPEAPVQVLKVVNRQYSCGGAGAVAVDLRALGAGCICIGAVGNDDNGKLLKEQLTELKADTSGIITLSDRPTISKQRLIGLAQHRHRQQLLRIDDECTRPFDEAEYDKILKIYTDKLSQADIVCIQDYNKGVVSQGLCCELIKLASGAGKKVLIDPPVMDDYSKYTGASLITPNRRETSNAVGFSIETVEDASRASGIIAEKLKVEAVVITLDKDGAFLHTSRTSEHIPTIPRSVYDVTGAGDMVLAMLAVSLAAGCDYTTAVQLANIAGGIEVEKFGVATVTVDEIVNEIIAENRGKGGKIHDIDTLVDVLTFHRQQKEKIVFTNGCFDVLHRGHIEFLKFCKSQGDVVVLGLNSDVSVRQIKGSGRPINNQHDRAAVLAALETVDYIVIFDEPDPLKTIEKVKPDVLVKGQDWSDKGVIGRQFVESGGGKVVLAPLVEGKSSTSTIEKMQSIQKKRSGPKDGLEAVNE
ncbi:MAG TPA: bifunctional heptose 7-phosphate kinase/heptose 1-phosphate adenyltransferase [Planctomycetes bacterium]|nr:bifunctional heptose 7-phosphate kinase/heptose 1-phosphate adenyltransferase [Planctomycetota bacterium]HIJ72177.1 bifunctional heptose 7-phosphate kinase/heptose 1-phosphate adenyltransferase [Planctomycetota bacterium]